VISVKQREAKLDKLEKEGGIIIKPKKIQKYIVEKEICQICNFQNHYSYRYTKKGGLKTIQDL